MVRRKENFMAHYISAEHDRDMDLSEDHVNVLLQHLALGSDGQQQILSIEYGGENSRNHQSQIVTPRLITY